MKERIQSCQNLKIYASVLSADFLSLAKNLKDVALYVDGLHWDVMDGHYVKNITLGPKFVLESRSLFPDIWFDVHIMASPSEDIIRLFFELSVQSLSFHPKTVKDPLKIINLLHSKRIKAGLAINLEDDLSVWPVSWWERADYLLVMAVNPGFGGQKFNNKALKNIDFIRQCTASDIFVDGGIVPETAQLCQNRGVMGVISGNFIFRHTSYKESIEALKKKEIIKEVFFKKS
ncbi:ribulose-phosphate 3-epimerase [Holospora obtusa F1]|uniref:Ribulose-phosphate 3-epimerase n=1 Tax=Holospora obtusa F1 TaxID=1399147 RepID=W6TT85_HOLOB|nr:ribulose-phosphate 3-epimerase [Holospora obtusa]ETZ06982.1 ribulose-phosphate 3-epimerase [Holospora obtusa F1]